METGLAKHGYTVDYGFFNGTCDGSDRQPVQTERSVTDATIEGLGKFAVKCDTTAAKMKAGEAHPDLIKTGENLNRDTNRYEPVYITWEQGTPDRQRRAVELAIHALEGDARHARAHARYLLEMADRLHGAALVAISDLERAAMDEAAARARNKVKVDVKTGTVTGAFGSKAERKAELDKINRAFEKCTRQLQDIYLAMPSDQRTDANTAVYYAPMYPHQWKPKHSAAALREFPQAAAIVAQIEELVTARESVKSAPLTRTTTSSTPTHTQDTPK